MARGSGEAQYVPILPSFDDFFKNVKKGAEKGGAEAGSTFADSMAAAVSKSEGAVEKATLQVERARKRQADAADATRLAEVRLEEVMSKGDASSSQILKATNDLNKARRKEQEEANASERASKNLSKAQEDLARANQEAEDSVAGVSTEFDGFAAKISPAVSKLGGMVGALAGVSAAAGAFTLGKDVAGEINNINNQLGYTGAQADVVADSVGKVLGTGVASNAEEAASAVGALEAQFDSFGKGGAQTVQGLADNFLGFSKTFGVEMGEATQTAGQLLENGLAANAEQAADLMTTAMQRVPVQMRDELPEIINEYGTNFRALGFSGEEAFGILVDAAGKGKWALDKTGDALKEFTIRGSDMSKTSVDAYAAIGLNAEEMSSKIAAGGAGAQDALQQVADGILGIEDPAERANTAIALFGTPLEDLSVDQIPQFLESLSGAEGAMEGFSGSSQAVSDSIANSLQGRLDMLKGTVSNLAGDAFMFLWDVIQNKVVPGFQAVGDWVQRQQSWLVPLTATVGTLTAAYGLLVVQQKINAAMNKIQAAGGLLKWFMSLEKVTRAQTAAQAALNLVMNANPIFLAVTAIAALTAGLWAFFTKTETGREMWANFTAAIADGWDWVSEKVGGGIEWIKTAFSGLKSLIVDGDFTGALRDAFGWEEDNPFVTGLLKVRDVLIGIKDFATGVWDILFKGDYTGLPFGLEEDSMLVSILFGIRDAFITAGEVIGNVLSFIGEALKVTFGVLFTAIVTPALIVWNLLTAAIQFAWDNIFQPIFNGLGELVTWLWEEVLSPIFGFLKEAFDNLILAVQIGWAFLSENVFPAIEAAFTWLWDTVISPILGWIVDGWNTLVAAFQAGWDWLRSTVFDAMAAAWNWLWNNVVSPVINYMVAGFEFWKNALGAVWNWIYTNVIQSYINAFQFLWNNVVSPILGWISDRWQWMGDRLGAVFAFVRDVVFEGLKNGLNVVRDSFSWAVDKIGAAWDRIRELTKKPVQFVVNTVYNNGIRKAWNAVSKIVGLDELPEYTFATGGILPGYTPGRDPYTFIEPRTGMSIGLSGGEAVIRPEATRVLGTGWVDGVNAAARMGGAKGVKKFLGGYADGGVIDSITNIVAEKFPMMTITSTWRNTNDYHGQGKAVDFSNGTDDTPQMQDAAAYFAENYGKALLELIHSPFGTNIKNGQSVGDGFGFYGAGTMAEHRNHVHVAADSPLEGGGMGGVLGIAAKAGAMAMNAVKSMWDKAISPIKGAIPQFPGIIGGLPGAVLDKLSTAAWDFVMSKLPGRSADGAYHGAVGGGVEQWRGMVVSVLKSKGFSEDLADTVLRRMNQESGGNPGSVNDWDSNAAAGTPSKGLMQVIDPTFQSYKDPGYDDIWDPEANLRASMNYAVARYGSLPAAYNQAGGYASGGIIPEFTGLYDSGGWLPHMGAALNLSGKPEPVLTDGHWEIVAGLIRKVGELIPPLHDVATNIADNLAPAMREMAAAWSGVTDGDRSHLSRLIGEDNARSVAWSAAWAGTASQKELFDTFSKLPKIGEYTSAFSGIIDGQDAIAKKYAEHGEALKVISEKEEALAEARKALSEAEGESVEMDKDQKRKLEDAESDLAKAREDGDAEKIAEKEKKLAEVREDIDDKSKQSEEKKAEAVKAAQEKVLSAEMDLSDARSAAADVAKAAGHAQIALAIEIANTIFDILEKLVSTFMKAKVDIAAGVTSMMGSVKDLTDLIQKQRETVIGLALDFVGAQIDVMDAARKSRFTQISGAQATLEASRSLAEAQAAFDAQRMADMDAALSLHQDLTLATDRWRWNLRKQVDGAVMDMSQWSDETRALYAELQAAQANLQLEQLEAQKANLKAAYDQTLAVLDLSDVTRDLQVASKQLALMSGEAFGFNQIGATVGERYASLAEELASIEAKKADFGTWANPANWFNGYYKNANRRQDEIRKEMAELAARPDFQGIGISEKDISKMVAGAGFMGLFGGAGDVKDYIANSKLGDPARALDRVKWESDLVELEASQKELRSKVERGRAELDYKSELGPLEERIKATELERESQKNWAEYWRATNDEVKSAIANIATYQEDTAAQLRAIAQRPVSLTLQIPSGKEALSVRELEAIEEQLRKQNAGIELRLDRIENPRPGGADISRKVRG